MNVLSNFNFSSPLNSIKSVLQNIPTDQQTIRSAALIIKSIALVIFVSISSFYISYYYHIIARQQRLSTEAPPEMLKIFQKYHYNFDKLPELALPSKSSAWGGIVIEPREMTSPVMRFTDFLGGKGIAFHICGKSESRRVCTEYPHQISNINDVWYVYHPYPYSKPYLWLGGGSSSIHKAMNERNEETPHNESVSEAKYLTDTGMMSESLMEGLLTGNDPDFKLGEKETPYFNLFV